MMCCSDCSVIEAGSDEIGGIDRWCDVCVALTTSEDEYDGCRPYAGGAKYVCGYIGALGCAWW